MGTQKLSNKDIEDEEEGYTKKAESSDGKIILITDIDNKMEISERKEINIKLTRKEKKKDDFEW